MTQPRLELQLIERGVGDVAGIDAGTVAPTVLGAVHRGVRVLDQHLQVLRVVRAR
jgi:hypothetical protein